MQTICVNAVGDACPIPVVKATKALSEFTEGGSLEVRVDNEIAIQNLSRLAAGKGLKYRAEKLEESLYTITMEVPGPVASAEEEVPLCRPDSRGDFVVAVDSCTMGKGSDELGATLMKGFLYALSQQDTLPAAILFYNGGAKLTCLESPALEDLQAMAAKGVEVLTCGTCLSYYGLTDQLAVGTVTNMYTIVEKMTGAARLVKP